MKISFLFFLFFALVSSSWAYQGGDFEVESWRCGAPLIQALRKSDPKHLLDDSEGKFKLKESFDRISESNLSRLSRALGTLSDKEQAILDLMEDKFHVPSIHRTSPIAAKYVFTQKYGIASPTKRSTTGSTPVVEQKLFSGWDCIFTALGPPFGTKEYGTTIIRLKKDEDFAWSSIGSGYFWVLKTLNLPASTIPSDKMKIQFAEQVFTNRDWDRAMALTMIQNIRQGATYRGLGEPYNKLTILDTLLAMKSSESFWKKIDRHRLVYMEGKYVDNVSINSVSYIQFREADKAVVSGWNLPAEWFSGGDEAFVQFFNRLD